MKRLSRYAVKKILTKVENSIYKVCHNKYKKTVCMCICLHIHGTLHKNTGEIANSGCCWGGSSEGKEIGEKF